MQKDRLKGVLLGPSVVALASSARCTAGHGHGERQMWIPPGLTFTPVRWEAVRIPLSPSFGRSIEFQLSEGNDFEVMVAVEKGDWYEDVLRLVYRLLQGLRAMKQLNLKELMEFL